MAVNDKSEKSLSKYESRRSFLQKTCAAAASASLIGTSKSWAGANDRIRTAVCGVHGQGWTHIRSLNGIEGVEVAAICDIDERELRRRSTDIEKEGWKKPQPYWDVRRLLEDDSIDAISIATPNHWHTLIAIWACQAGKDVYVEKPLSHNVWEGRQLVKAARKYGRIVQHGTQSRTSEAVQEGIRRLQEGLIGEVYMAKGMCYKWRDTIGYAPDEAVPDGVHYDLWMGPAPERPFSRNRFHYNWHWQWPYGNGDIGNQGVHEMDIARWGLGVGLPSKIQAMGGHFMFKDDQTTPNVLLATMEYPEEKKMLVFEVRHWITNHEGGIGEGPDNTVGNIFYGSEGYMCIAANRYWTVLGKEREPGPKRDGTSAHIYHFQNFIDTLRSRVKDGLNSECIEGHYSSALCHLSNIAYRTGTTIEFDPESETIKGDRDARKLLDDSDRGYRREFEVPSRV